MRESVRTGKSALRRGALAAVTLAGTATVVVLLATVEPGTIERARSASLPLLALSVLLVLGAWAALAGRMLLNGRALGYRLTFERAALVSLSSEFGAAVSPGGAGGPAVRVALLRRLGVPAAMGATMAGADILLDGIFFVLMMPLALTVLVTEPVCRLWAGNGTATLGRAGLRFAIAVALLAGLVWAARAMGRTRRVRRWRAARYLFVLCRRARRELADMRQAATFLYRRRKRLLLCNLVLAGIQWTCRYGVLPVLLVAFGCTRNPLPLLPIQGLLLMVSALVVIPGGGGSVEALSALILPSFMSRPLVGVVVLVWRLLTYHLNLMAGGASFAWAMRGRSA